MEDKSFRIPALVLGLCLLAMLFMLGCASMDYDWKQARAPSVKPWLYVKALDVDRACRTMGADPYKRLARINGCAVWRTEGCLILLPYDAPEWIVWHEERHCAGLVH